MADNRLGRTSVMEHLAFTSDLDLQGFCQRFQKALNLPEFKFDGANETEWGFVEVGSVEYNVSRPYKPGTLQIWDKSVPAGCNFGVSLILHGEHPDSYNHEWAFDNLVVPVAQKIADEFRITVHYHRTWLGVGQSVERNMVFRSQAA